MTALVVMDAAQPLDEQLEITPRTAGSAVAWSRASRPNHAVAWRPAAPGVDVLGKTALRTPSVATIPVDWSRAWTP